MKYEVTLIVATYDNEELVDEWGDPELYSESHADSKEAAVGDAVENIFQDLDESFINIEKVVRVTPLGD